MEDDLMGDIDEVEVVSSSRVSHDEDVSAEGKDSQKLVEVKTYFQAKPY